MIRANYLPLPRFHDRKTTTLSSTMVSGCYVRHYSIRTGVRQTGYARGGPEGPLGPIIGWGVQIDDPEGCIALVDETRDPASARALYERAISGNPIEVAVAMQYPQLQVTS